MTTEKQIIQGQIISNRKVAVDHYVMKLNVQGLSANIEPGQFAMLKVQGDTTDPLLKIPLSIYDVDENNVSFLYRVVGKATKILQQKQEGEYLELLIPLGNGFDLAKISNPDISQVLLVGGGCGIAALHYAARKIAESNKEILVYLGVASDKYLICVDEFRALNAKIKIATDDGSYGFKGNVIELLENDFVKQSANLMIYASGPEIMLQELIKYTRRYNIPTQVALESYMACGFGVCLGCSVKTTEGNKLCCTDGPVFNAEQINVVL